MKKIYSLLIVALVCNMAVAQKKHVPLAPSKKQPPKPAVAPTSGASLSDESLQGGSEKKAWMDYMTPGPMHQMLASFDGEWKEQITFWASAGAQPTMSSASCTNQMIMDNRYQESTHNSVIDGMPFEGRGYLGYDNAKKVFVSTWLDNMGTGIMNMEGQWDEKNKTIHFRGTSVDPMTGKAVDVREELRFVDNNNQFMEMYMNKEGKEFKNMEIKYMR